MPSLDTRQGRGVPCGWRVLTEREVDERGEEVDGFCGLAALYAAAGEARHPDQHWDVRRDVEVGMLVPLPVLAQLPAVV